MEEVAAGLARSEKEGKAKWLKDLIPCIYRESLEGAATLVPKLVCVGRKGLGGVQGEGHMETPQANAHDEQVKANEHSREPESMEHGGG